MGRSKRKTNSPLHKDGGKNPRTADAEDGGGSQAGQDGDSDLDVIADLKEFIRTENARNNRSLAEELRRHNEERMTALESSLSFALATNETLAKRLVEVEQQAQQAERHYRHHAERLATVEDQLDQLQQRELQGWLVFSGPAIPRAPRSGRGEDAAQQLQELIRSLMNYDLDMRQIGELQRDERQIRVHFTTVAAGSDKFFLVRNKTRLKGTGLYIRERLTPFRQWLFNELLKLKRGSHINTVFTREGTVFVVTSQQDRPRPVRSEAALERLRRHLTERPANQRNEMPVRQSQRASPGATEATPVVGGGSSPDIEGAAVASLGDSASRPVALRRSSSRDPQDVNVEQQQHLSPDGDGGEVEDGRTGARTESVPVNRGLRAAALPAGSVTAEATSDAAGTGSVTSGAGSVPARADSQLATSERGGRSGIALDSGSGTGRGSSSGRAAAGRGSSAGRVGWGIVAMWRRQRPPLGSVIASVVTFAGSYMGGTVR